MSVNIPKEIISYKEYKKQVCKFNFDSQDWLDLEFTKFYTTSNDGWIESSDNAHDGLDLSWVFHKKSIHEEEILMHYLYSVNSYINYVYNLNCLDDIANYDQFTSLLKVSLN